MQNQSKLAAHHLGKAFPCKACPVISASVVNDSVLSVLVTIREVSVDREAKEIMV